MTDALAPASAPRSAPSSDARADADLVSFGYKEAPRADKVGPSARADADFVSFGYKEVPRADKAGMVRAVFDSVAPRYDLMNDLMSAGVHRLWKDSFVAQCRPQPGWSMVDVAGGTGDIAFRLLAQASGSKVTVCDYNAAMVSVGRDRALDRGAIQTSGGVDFVVGDAMRLPFPDRAFDLYTISFGLRNVTDIDAALAEARRVLKPGARFFCLEFSKVVIPGLDKLYDFYSFQALPRLGQLVAGDAESYRYLAESIRRFPDQQRLADRMAAAGLRHAGWRNLSGGIAAIHWGRRI